MEEQICSQGTLYEQFNHIYIRAIGIDDTEVAVRKAFLEFTEADACGLLHPATC